MIRKKKSGVKNAELDFELTSLENYVLFFVVTKSFKYLITKKKKSLLNTLIINKKSFK